MGRGASLHPAPAALHLTHPPHLRLPSSLAGSRPQLLRAPLSSCSATKCTVPALHLSLKCWCEGRSACAAGLSVGVVADPCPPAVHRAGLRASEAWGSSWQGFPRQGQTRPTGKHETRHQHWPAHWCQHWHVKSSLTCTTPFGTRHCSQGPPPAGTPGAQTCTPRVREAMDSGVLVLPSPGAPLLAAS